MQSASVHEGLQQGLRSLASDFVAPRLAHTHTLIVHFLSFPPRVQPALAALESIRSLLRLYASDFAAEGQMGATESESRVECLHRVSTARNLGSHFSLAESLHKRSVTRTLE